jgi:hypothetical protein
VHVDHHFNRTVPIGVNYEREVEEDNFKYDAALWENIERFLPEGVSLPASEAPGAANAAFASGQMDIPGGPSLSGASSGEKQPVSLALAGKALLVTHIFILLADAIGRLVGLFAVTTFAVLSKLCGTLLPQSARWVPPETVKKKAL